MARSREAASGHDTYLPAAGRTPGVAETVPMPPGGSRLPVDLVAGGDSVAKGVSSRRTNVGALS